MAVAPLFAASMTVLKARLRLTGATSADGLATIDQAVLDVRAGFYRRLGAARITEIKTTNDIDAPATNAEILRSVATATEVLWARLKLMRTLPTLFMDASGSQQQRWNDEAGFRSAIQQTEAEIKRLEAELEENLQLLEGTDDIGDESTVHATCLEPDDEPDLPGATVWPSLRNED